MRPIKLSMTAFGPYAKRTVLDLDKLGEKGIYLITGDTGSGKTTIFDGITYALYGEMSGGVRRREMMRSTFADEDTPTEVELVFSYGGDEYRILRRPSYERRKKRGEGRIKTAAVCEFELPKGRIITKDKEATTAITELLGVDRSQFTQIAMIAQGDFRKLIFAKTEERIGIFRHLFKTEKYRTLQDAIKSEAKSLEEARTGLVERMEIHTESMEIDDEKREILTKAIGSGEDFDGDALEKTILEEDRIGQAECRKRIGETENELKKIQSRLDRAAEEKRLKEELEKSLENKKRKEEALKEAREELASAESHRDEIKKLNNETAIIEARISERREAEKLELLKQEREKKEREEKYAEAVKEYEALADENEKAQARYRKIQRKLMDAQAGILAKDLIDGEPCPVCGSTKHPAPAKLDETPPTEDDMKEAEREASLIRKETEEASLRAAALKGKANAHEEETEKRMAELEKEIAESRKQKEELKEKKKKAAALLDEIERCTDRTVELGTKIEGIGERIRTIKESLKEYHGEYTKGEETEDLSSLEEAAEEAEAKKRRLQREADEIGARLANNEKNLAAVLKISKELRTGEERYRSIAGLAETVGGTRSGAEKIALETYVQMRFFDRIIERANTRLMIMTGGRYMMVRRKKSSSMQGQSGLDLDVIDYHNGSQRDIRTLSGGESFDASLSLALGLSDEIQSSAGGIRLDAMFVDEGFGTLDSDALNRAVKALASLGEGNKLVGIISHVDEMKMRIDRQIHVTKNPDGTSNAEIMV